MEEPQFANFDAIYDQPITVHHWQLKDLVQCESQSVLYCIHERSTIRYDTQKEQASVVQTLNFSPNCLAIGHGLIATGGQHSHLNVRLLSENKTIYSGTIGGAVNNSLRITETPLGLMLLVCNNDKSIRMFSLPSMDRIAAIHFKEPVNYASTTQDAEFLASVGDTTVTSIHQSTEDGYRKLGLLHGFTDVGMCCAWDPQGVRVAAASQDGSVCIWDRRSCKSIHRFTAQTSCRNVKFSTSSTDLLAFAEDSGTCHLVDTRNLNEQQILQTNDDARSRVFAGLCFSPDARKIFVGTTLNGIFSFVVDSVNRRRFSEGSFL